MGEIKKMEEDEYLWIKAILESLIGRKKANARKYREMDGYSLAGLCIGEITLLRGQSVRLESQYKALSKECDRLRVVGLELNFNKENKRHAKI